MELSFEMNACERLEKEIENETPFNQTIGKFLLENLKTDKVLEQRYFDKKITLKAVGEYVIEEAKKYLKNKNGAIEDKVVFGWVLHYVQDEKPTDSEATSVIYHDPEVVETPKVEKKPKPKKVKKDSGQLSLLDFGLDFGEE